ncbi:MAG TPA: MarR family winged helix-turn-helix transcriptional regulator [Kofleriaceae bacterium]|nr:MarR family winged helix-turn-helix transcriptional regulator [Kofleriaceae bacterium]
MGSHASRGPRGLRDPGAAAVMNALRRVVRFLRLADRESESAVGLSAAQLFVLHTLGHEPAGSLAELAERTLTDQSSVSTVVAKLVARKLVARTAAKGDRRRAELRLTPAGERLARSAPHVPQTRIAEVVRAMPPARRAQLVLSLEGLVSAIGASDVPPRMLFEDEPNRRRTRGRR